MPLSSVRQAPAKEQIYSRLQEAILALAVKPGDLLVEATLAQTYGVSRTPVREALARLVDDGLVEVYPRRGYIVTRVTLQDVLESYHLRILIEPEAAALAAGRDTRALVAALDANMAQHKQNATIRLNHEFHGTIAQASGNQRLARLVNKLLDEVLRVASLDPFMVDPAPNGHAEHEAVVDGLRRRDPEAAKSAMRQHLEAGRDRVLRFLQFSHQGAAGR